MVNQEIHEMSRQLSGNEMILVLERGANFSISPPPLTAETPSIRILKTSEDEVRVRCNRSDAEKLLMDPAVVLGIWIENVVATANLGQMVDLELVKASMEEAEYERERFPGLVLRLDNDSGTATFLVFKSGRVVCPGYQSVRTLRAALSLLCARLRELGALKAMETPPSVEIVNLVAQVMLKGKINVEACAEDLKGIIYEPTMFPGAIYRITEPVKAAFLLFKSGKVICGGAKNEEELKTAATALNKVLIEHRLLRRALNPHIFL